MEVERVTERLTEKTDEGIWVKEFPGDNALKTLYQCYGAEPLPDYSNCDEGYLAIKKLADYETAEEEGRLMVLPCKLNETVYLLLNKNDFAEKIIKCRIREVSIGFCGVKLSLISEDSMIGHLDWYDVEEVGKAVFLTRKEAEKALREMEVRS